MYDMYCVAGGLCSLTIEKALPEDEGQYKCRVETSLGKTETSCMVLVDGEYHVSLTQLYHSHGFITTHLKTNIIPPTDHWGPGAPSTGIYVWWQTFLAINSGH